MDRPGLAGHAAIGQPMIEIAHLAEIVDDGKRDGSGLLVALDDGARNWRRESSRSAQGDAASGAGKVTSSPCASGRSGSISVAADSSSRTGSGDGQIIGQ